MDSQIKLKELKIENLASEADTAYADPNMADVVIRNLLSNCVKFCNPGDSIVLELIKKEEKVLLSIRDTGPGISQKDLDKLFSLEHTTSTGTSGEKGHHLGLILCKDMIEQNNGKIWVESTVGVGTVFWIEFPASEK
jgi:signal transduction histidine kinase